MGEQIKGKGRKDWQSKGATPKGKVDAEGKSFSPDPNQPAFPHDLTGPAGDPAEGKRPADPIGAAKAVLT